MNNWTHNTLRRGRILAGAGVLLALLVSPFASAQRTFRSDPVEKLREVLNSRNRYDPFASPLDTDYSAKVRKGLNKFKKRLDEATSKDVLRSAADLSSALLLIEWDRDEQVLQSDEARRALGLRRGETVREARSRLSHHAFREIVRRLFNRDVGKEDYVVQARALEFQTRTRLTERFIASVKRSLEARDPIRQVAVCHLILETMNSAMEQITEPLPLYDAIIAPFTDPLIQLAGGKDKTPVEVRASALRALGRFHTSADKVGQAFRQALAPSQPDGVRKAAADGLEGLIYSATGTERLRGSEPGVSVREARRSNQALSRDLRLAVAAAIIPPAGKGLVDKQPLIREQCALALMHAANSLFDEIRRQVPPSLDKLTLDENLEIHLPVGELAPVMKEFAALGPALRKTFVDPDPKVRVQTCLTAEALARTYAILLALRKANLPVFDSNGLAPEPKAPLEPENPAKGKLGAARTPRLPVLLVRRQVKEDRPRPSPRLLDENEDALGKMLLSLSSTASGRGLDDPDPKARRAAAEAIESLSSLAEPAIPRLLKALKDRDVFVRWIAARILGKLGKQPDAVVPALQVNFEDADLDSRIAAINAVAKFGPQAVSAVPALGKRLREGDAEIRVAVLKALENIGPGSKAALPDIAGQFGNPDPRVRAGAATLVGKFLAAGRPFLPGLRKLVDDPDQDVRRAASGAILAIE